MTFLQRLLKVFLLFLLILLLQCGVKQPIERTIATEYGEIIIASTPDGARILMDGQVTERFTLDTLTQVPLGTHFFQVYLEGYHSSPDSIHLQVTPAERLAIAFQLAKIDTTGRIVLTSTPSRAAIVVNGMLSGLSTPDTLILPGGHHEIELRKNGYANFSQQIELQAGTEEKIDALLRIQNRVLLEAFGNVSCTPCVQAAHNLSVFEQEQSADQYVLVEYFANWPSPNDPFYKEAPQDVMQRVSYYQLAALPSLFIAGATGVDATRYDDIITIFQSTLSQQPGRLGLSVTKNLNADQLEVSVELNVGDEKLLSPSLRLFSAIIENNIHYDVAPGSNGLQDFHHVFRGFLSARNGDVLSNEHQQIVNYRKTWPNWNYAQSAVIAFVQDIETKTILQCTSE